MLLLKLVHNWQRKLWARKEIIGRYYSPIFFAFVFGCRFHSLSEIFGADVGPFIICAEVNIAPPWVVPAHSVAWTYFQDHYDSVCQKLFVLLNIVYWSSLRAVESGSNFVFRTPSQTRKIVVYGVMIKWQMKWFIHRQNIVKPTGSWVTENCYPARFHFPSEEINKLAAVWRIVDINWVE